MQQLSRQQSGQAAVMLQQLLMQPPAQRTSHLLLRQQQSCQQLRELLRNQENRRGRHTEPQEHYEHVQQRRFIYPLVVQRQVLSSGKNHLQSLRQVIHESIQHLSDMNNNMSFSSESSIRPNSGFILQQTIKSQDDIIFRRRNWTVISTIKL